jgi:hypothetical protein
MTPNLESLRITSAELDHLTGLEISPVFMGSTIRPSVFRSPPKLLSLLITEGLVVGVCFMMGLGLALVLVRQREGLHQIGLLLMSIGAIVGVSVVLWHLYQRYRAKTLRTLAHLLEGVDRHNDIIQALQVMEALDAAQAEPAAMPYHPEVIQALQATRDSLVSALMTEKILRQHRLLMHRRQELFTVIETNLTTLRTLQINHQTSEYRQFLQQALEIGMAVHQELGSMGSI